MDSVDKANGKHFIKLRRLPARKAKQQKISGSTRVAASSPSLVSHRYRDSKTDIALSSYGGSIFRVHSYILTAQSDFFRDLLSLPPPLDDAVSSATPISPSTVKHAPSIPRSKPDVFMVIPITASDLDLRLWLDFMSRRPSTIPPTSIDTCCRLLTLCDKYDTPQVANVVQTRLREAASAAPWYSFCLASQDDNLELAKSAVAVFGQERWLERSKLKKYRDVDKIPIYRLRECGMEYFFALLRSLAEGERKMGAGGDIDWSQTADDFMREI